MTIDQAQARSLIGATEALAMAVDSDPELVEFFDGSSGHCRRFTDLQEDVSRC